MLVSACMELNLELLGSQPERKRGVPRMLLGADEDDEGLEEEEEEPEEDIEDELEALAPPDLDASGLDAGLGLDAIITEAAAGSSAAQPRVPGEGYKASAAGPARCCLEDCNYGSPVGALHGRCGCWGQGLRTSETCNAPVLPATALGTHCFWRWPCSNEKLTSHGM